MWLAKIEGVFLPAMNERTNAVVLWHVIKEPLAHGVLIMGVSFSLMHYLFNAYTMTQLLGRGDSDFERAGVCSADSDQPVESGAERVLIMRHWFSSVFYTLFIALVIAVAVEWLQSLLPLSFQRGFAWGDIGASLMGGFMGVLFSTCWSVVTQTKMLHVAPLFLLSSLLPSALLFNPPVCLYYDALNRV
ncbi:MAG: hypothetical protein ACSHW7_15585 [Patiriisocius sp.]|uniref:hypothetical protein n=1 Tax=Patiriisocius sp. TaxID=2822396 RepID=UPI003EF9AEFF